MYNYPRFRIGYYQLQGDIGLKVGDQVVDFYAHNIAGELVQFSDYYGKPIILETGSLSCNVFVRDMREMNRLAQRYPEYQHILLYVREAHPGENICAHRDFTDKISCARLLKELENEKRTILVDDLAGTAHQACGAYPNMLYVIDAQGVVIYKDIWSLPARTAQVLQCLRAGRAIDQHHVAKVHAAKHLRDLQVCWRVMHRAGWQAIWDFIREIGKAMLSLKARKLRPH